MTFFSGSLKDTEQQFLLIVKVRPSKTLYTSFLESPGSYFTFRELSRIFTKEYAHNLGAEQQSLHKITRLESNDSRYDSLIYRHESGPELFILPIASFLSDAVTAGVVGNFAYDLLKIIYASTISSFRKLMIEDSGLSASPLQESISSTDGEQVTISDSEISEMLEITLRTPEGLISARYDPEKGIDPEVIRLITRRLKSYKSI